MVPPSLESRTTPLAFPLHPLTPDAVFPNGRVNGEAVVREDTSEGSFIGRFRRNASSLRRFLSVRALPITLLRHRYLLYSGLVRRLIGWFGMGSRPPSRSDRPHESTHRMRSAGRQKSCNYDKESWRFCQEKFVIPFAASSIPRRVRARTGRDPPWHRLLKDSRRSKARRPSTRPPHIACQGIWAQAAWCRGSFHAMFPLFCPSMRNFKLTACFQRGSLPARR